MRPALSPRDCAILVAVPMTRDEFLRAAAAQIGGGFVDGVVRGRRASWAWDNIYRPIAEAMGRILGDVEGMGATVVRAATVADLAAAAVRFQALTVVAHWRFPGLVAADVLDPQALARMVQAAVTGPLSRFRAAAADSLVSKLCQEIAESERALRELEKQDLDLWTGEVPDSSPRLQRVELEAQLPAQVLRRAGVVEFADGFSSLETIVGSIPEAYDGVLDLSICNSAVLGLAIRDHREHCIAVINRRQFPLHFAVARYRAVLRMLAGRAQPYVDAVLSVHRDAALRVV